MSGTPVVVGVNKGTLYSLQSGGQPNWDPYVDLLPLINGDVEVLEIEMINGNNGNDKYKLEGMVYAKIVGDNLVLLVDGRVQRSGTDIRLGLYTNPNQIPSNGNLPFEFNVANITLPLGNNTVLHIRTQNTSYYTPFMIPIWF